MIFSIFCSNNAHSLLLLILLYFIVDVYADPEKNATIVEKQSDGTETEDQPTETQSAQCTITAGDVQASAQATISKKLEGVCGSKQMAKSFEILEARLTVQLNQIRSMMQAMLSSQSYAQAPYVAPSMHHRPNVNQQFGPPNMQYVPAQTAPQYPIGQAYQQYLPAVHIMQSSGAPFFQEIPTTAKPSSSKPTFYSTRTSYSPETSTVSESYSSTVTPTANTTQKPIKSRPIQLKSLERILKPKSMQRTGPRDFEVHRFNNTVLSGDEIRIFTYYWRIENFTMKLKSNLTLISSPVFSISGLHLKVNARLNYLNRDYLLFQLESVPEEQIAFDSNVVLETGSIFKAIETKKLFRHKIIILDQETPTSDLISHEFFNTNDGFPVPHSAIVSGPYAKDSNLLIKIVIYL